MSSPSLPGYENLELIGKGGFSRVYRADQAKLKRKVAVKVLNFGLNDEADRVSFARETELMGRVSTHPNIVTVHDTAFTAEGQPCIVMEHYPGGSLADLINEVGKLNTREALEVGVAIASALHASHVSGVLHCDIKPQNILISEFGQPALGDFGISTFDEDRTRTRPDSGSGFTLPYAAPEIVEGESPTVASDVYSLAATLYTSLSGRRPFGYPTSDNTQPAAVEHARRILLEPVRSLVDEGVPVEFDSLIRGAMSKEPAERPASAAVFANACHQIGQALGFGTSTARIADQGALRVIDSEAVGHGQVDLSMLVRQRSADRLQEPREVEVRDELIETSVDATRERSRLVDGETVVSTSRRRLAAIGGGLAVLAVVALLVFATRGGSENDIAAPPLAPASSSAQASASNPILAPTQPRDVQLERIGDHALTVRWVAPAAELESGDVTYEVRRQDGGDSEPWITETSDVTMPAIANNEGVCVTVLAVRSNRTSSPTAPACSTPLPIDIELEPNSCVAPCEVVLTVSDSAADTPAAVAIIDRSLESMAEIGFRFDEALAPGTANMIQVDETTASGDYLVVVTYSDTSVQSVLFTVLPD